MIQIRPEQFAVFQQESEEAFVETLLKFARGNLTAWLKFDSDAIVRERIKSGVARARSHGFTGQPSLAKFVMLMLRFCPNFDRAA